MFRALKILNQTLLLVSLFMGVLVQFVNQSPAQMIVGEDIFLTVREDRDQIAKRLRVSV